MNCKEKLELLQWLNKKMVESYTVRATSEAAVYNEVYCHVEKMAEPRVMTLEEIPDAVFGWMEIFGQIIPCVLEDVYADDTVGFANIEDGHDYMCASDYSKTWRVWTSHPTEAEREATPWMT